MTTPVSPVLSFGQESLLTDYIATHARPHPGPVVEQVVGRTERPLDKVELKSNYIDDIRNLRAAGPGVPLFQSTDAPEPIDSGKGNGPANYNSSGRSLLVDAFG